MGVQDKFSFLSYYSTALLIPLKPLITRIRQKYPKTTLQKGVYYSLSLVQVKVSVRIRVVTVSEPVEVDIQFETEFRPPQRPITSLFEGFFSLIALPFYT